MNESTRGQKSREHESPEGKVIGAVEPEAVASATGALAAAGFPADAIDVVTAADLNAFEAEHGHDGLRGIVERFLLSVGEDLNAMEDLRRAANAGHTLIGVSVAGDEAMDRAAEILRDNGAHEITHFGRWTITAL